MDQGGEIIFESFLYRVPIRENDCSKYHKNYLFPYIADSVKHEASEDCKWFRDFQKAWQSETFVNSHDAEIELKKRRQSKIGVNPTKKTKIFFRFFVVKL
jgi:hypothetical protein